MSRRLPMTGQFDPRLLIPTAIRAVVSTVFGRYADRREAIAATNAIDATDFDEKLVYSSPPGEEFWFDFLADTGDGWNPTYAMARLVSEDSLTVRSKDMHQGRSCKLPRGRFLLLGGDQVYPSASREDYAVRFREPFEQAYAPDGRERWDEGSEDAPHLYALPGDHDWHDGLNAFFGLFCRRRTAAQGSLGAARPGAVIAGRSTWQTRSYFGLQLPQNWWLWGTDSQMEGYIDQPQIDYFRHVAGKWMAPRSNLILCVAEPSWANVDPRKHDDRYRNLNYLEQLATTAKHVETGAPMEHRLKLVLTGDSHHYARHVERDVKTGAEIRNYIACGGGGAFTSATHHLDDRTIVAGPPRSDKDAGGDAPPPLPSRSFAIARAPEGEKALFPSASASRCLGWRNLWFPWTNPEFTAALGIYYLLFAWSLGFNATSVQASDLAALLGKGSLCEALATTLSLIFVSPQTAAFVAIIIIAYLFLADARHGVWVRLLAGGLHAAANLSAVILAIVAVVRALAGWWDGGFGSAAALLAAGCAGGLASGLVFGFYYALSTALFARDTDFGFSALKLEGHKSFLRLRIDRDGRLTVFPVGLEKVPDDRREILKNPELAPHLIEQPIEIR